MSELHKLATEACGFQVHSKSSTFGKSYAEFCADATKRRINTDSLRDFLARCKELNSYFGNSEQFFLIIMALQAQANRKIARFEASAQSKPFECVAVR